MRQEPHFCVPLGLMIQENHARKEAQEGEKSVKIIEDLEPSQASGRSCKEQDGIRFFKNWSRTRCRYDGGGIIVR